jgi:hypothetical protein
MPLLLQLCRLGCPCRTIGGLSNQYSTDLVAIEKNAFLACPVDIYKAATLFH